MVWIRKERHVPTRGKDASGGCEHVLLYLQQAILPTQPEELVRPYRDRVSSTLYFTI